MHLRPAIASDLDNLLEIDGTIESLDYLHIDAGGEGLERTWRLSARRLREKRIRPNALDEDRWFDVKQIVTGIEDGIALLAEYDDLAAALLVARPNPARGTLEIIDLRVDYDYRRQGLATAMLFQTVQAAREAGHRAVHAQSQADNAPAAHLLLKCGFELAGLDTQRSSNHDLVKESVTLFWYVDVEAMGR